MELKEILSISKLPGLFQIKASRDNGLIVTPLGENKSKFVSSRQHMFTPLENITIYTEDSNIELKDVFQSMKASKQACPESKAADADFRAYFTEVVPNHDQQRVYISDIKKIVKWFTQLDAHNLFAEEEKPEKKSGTKKKKESKATGKTKEAKKK